MFCGNAQNVGDFCKIAALSCRNRAGSREGGRVLVTAGFNCFQNGNSSFAKCEGIRKRTAAPL